MRLLLCKRLRGNETLMAQVLPAQMQNVSIHYKTVRQVEVEPLDAVSLDAHAD